MSCAPGHPAGRRRSCASRSPTTIWRRSAALPLMGASSCRREDHAYRSPDVVRFLRVLLRKIAGKLLVIWDGSPIHRGQPVKDFLRKGAAKRLHLEQLPGYAPELNPDEGIWNYLKRVELRNLCCSDLPARALALALRRAKERLRHKRTVIQACFRQAGYQV